MSDQPTWAWWLAVAALGLPAALLPLVNLSAPDAAWPLWAQTLVLHPDRGWQQPPWVWWTAAWLHGSLPHWWHNLAALGLLAGCGALWRPTRLDTLLLVAVAWPLTQVGMLAQSDLHRYVGLSGVLHAMAAQLLFRRLTSRAPTEPRWMLAAALLALIGKVLMENPWHLTLVADPRSAINVAPWVHFCGATMGIGLGGLATVAQMRTQRRPSAN